MIKIIKEIPDIIHSTIELRKKNKLRTLARIRPIKAPNACWPHPVRSFFVVNPTTDSPTNKAHVEANAWTILPKSYTKVNVKNVNPVSAAYKQYMTI